MFEMPEDCGELTAEALNELLGAARTEAQAILALPTKDQDLARLGVLADNIDALNAAKLALSKADAAHDALAARFAVTEEVAEVEVEVDETPVAVVASTKAVAKVATKAVAKVVLPEAKVKNSGIVASANVPGVNAGSAFEGLLEAVPHMLDTWSGLRGATDGTKRHVFSIKENTDPKLTANGKNDQEVVTYAVNQARLAQGKGLLAAGGWCAAPEQRYDICDLAQLDGMLDLPTISVPRGSISYYRDLRYSAVNTLALTGIGDFTNTELEVDPPVVKPCVEIPCVDPVTFTLDAVSFCVRAGILQHRAFPELVESWLRQALIAYQHYLNARRIAAIVALATAHNVVTAGASFGSLALFLSFLELQAIDIRFDHGMAENEVVEGFAPFWLPAVFRADLSRRQMDVDWNFTQAELDSLLAARNIRIQWVKDFIDAPFAGAGDVTTWPTTVNVVLYPAGAYLNAAEPIIRVGGIVDSTLLQTNREQLLFVETGEGVVPACGDGTLVTIPLCPNGATSGPVTPAAGTNACATG